MLLLRSLSTKFEGRKLSSFWRAGLGMVGLQRVVIEDGKTPVIFLLDGKSIANGDGTAVVLGH